MTKRAALLCLLASVASADWRTIPASTFPVQGSDGQCLVAVTDGGMASWLWTQCGVASLTCNAGQALTSSGTTQSCTSTLTASDVACASTCVADGEIAGVSGSKVSGAVATATLAATATALAANPADCTSNQFATGIAASGDLTCAQPAFSNISGTPSTTQRGAVKIITNNVTTSAGPITTGLSWSVAANTEYGFHCVLNTSGTATSLARFNLNGPGSPTTVSFATQRWVTTSTQTLLVLQAFSSNAQTAACTSSCNTTALPTLVYGTILNGNNAGTVDLQVTSSTGGQTVTVYRGSYCEIF